MVQSIHSKTLFFFIQKNPLGMPKSGAIKTKTHKEKKSAHSRSVLYLLAAPSFGQLATVIPAAVDDWRAGICPMRKEQRSVTHHLASLQPSTKAAEATMF